MSTGTSEKFYKSPEWKRLRARALKRDGYMDQLLLREGKHREADTVHHALPIDRFPEYRLKLWNVISVTRETHEALHNRITGGLSPEGEMLMHEIARKAGVKLSKLTLVVGMPGAGKTTYVKQHLGSGLVYDLDYIAAAFRLATPKSEYHKAARLLANGMVRGFAQNARRKTGHVFVIRTAPMIEEVLDVDPDEIVYCKRPGQMDLPEKRKTLDDLIEWAKANGVPVIEP